MTAWARCAGGGGGGAWGGGGGRGGGGGSAQWPLDHARGGARRRARRGHEILQVGRGHEVALGAVAFDEPLGTGQRAVEDGDRVTVASQVERLIERHGSEGDFVPAADLKDFVASRRS